MTEDYQPMVNDRRDFDPVDPRWSYILDEQQPAWRELVAVRERRVTWPFQPHGVRWRYFHAARLSPDWCFYAWGRQYVLADWDEERPALVNVRLCVGTRHSDLTVYAVLDLREQAFSYPAREVSDLSPAEVAEVDAKCGKLLAFFADACEHWQAGDQAHPATAADLYTANGGT
jgi:hypothetical protein